MENKKSRSFPFSASMYDMLDKKKLSGRLFLPFDWDHNIHYICVQHYIERIETDISLIIYPFKKIIYTYIHIFTI